MIVRLHRGQMRWFRERGRRAYPRELLAFLVGRHLGPELIGVCYLHYPRLIQDPNSVSVPRAEYERALELTRDPGLRIVGTIHTHCDALPMMSAQDRKSHVEEGDSISGILTILASGNTALEFWEADNCVAATVEWYPTRKGKKHGHKS
jgi:proteasome lid subunit RPN8/RPN11